MSAEELNESELGTQEYWDMRYKMEVSNFRDHGNVGEIWFGEDSMDRVCRWIFKSNVIQKDSKIVDVGCGNGIFLIQLYKEDYTNLTGVDYSQDAITLATEIARKENCNITYQVMDLITTSVQNSFDVVHDKGTYDAISLSTDAKKNRDTYVKKIYDMLTSNGLFIITSCNWTLNELIQHFKEKFEKMYLIPTPQFNFGGRTGSSFTSVVFKKRTT